MRIRVARCGVGWLVLLAAALPAQAAAAPLDSEALWEKALIHELAIKDGRRVWYHLRDARKLLVDHGAKIDEALWSRASELIEKLARARTADEKIKLRTELVAALEQVREQILAALPTVGAFDHPNDDGGKLMVFWRPPPGAKQIKISRRDVTKDKPWKLLRGDVDPRARVFKDEHLIRPWRKYEYKIVAVMQDGSEQLVGQTVPVQARGNFLNTNRAVFGILVLVLCGTVLYYIRLARSGRELNIRKIAGLEAVDDAVGRATEMGRPIMFIPGIQDMNDIQTIAGLTVLGRVARVAAERDALLEVPTSKSLVMTAARETVQSAYMDIGRPDAYDEKKIYYTTDEQFGYVAAVTGAMVREKPATCFYMGAFFAESLILAETANMTGSIQIAGTAMPAQLPFFVAACDYTLIGEEFFAASAYLSGEPQQLGSLKGQDMGKLFGLIIILVATLLVTLINFNGWQYGWPGYVLDFITHGLLDTADK